jgi:hypothetical protein
MAIRDALVAGISTLNKITKTGGLQAQCGFRHFVSADGEGSRTYNPPTSQAPATIDAHVDWKQKSLRTSTGELTVSRAALTLTNIPQILQLTGGEGISDDDVFILPDGTTGPIIDMGGYIDAGTGQPFATEVFLG